MPPRMFCFPDDQAILIKHSFETFEDGPLFGRNIGTLVLKQFLDLRTAEQLQAGILDWRSSEQDLILFLRWVYTDDLAAPDGGLPSNVDLISLASIAGLLELAKLHDDILDALDLLHCRKHWAASASVSCWDQWNRPVANEEPAFWKKRHDYLVARAAADLTVDHLVENIIPANLTYKMLRVLRRCQGLRRASGRPFPFHIMKMFYLSDLPGDTSDFPIILSTPEPDRCRINVQIEKPRR
ncbi:uncharacterized protein K444DRAFT_102871 [Hyaloscypha bicolor E]|uniref:Uncharacterized protein n=1 Tax=Hyaloscypha bicolor E TaxID=1095630 RepID=A0A2J6SWZ6_9HELO|nr:uncharacterized protein K444DRAFT_102871 [Hyaloscypha bicolor E]PMD55305.1 hypothetical protein K444DRAFT_102871 [Hyaloscypha bicolor E]